ncbi:MAG TPA: hypothetical protein VJR22_03360 [Candidatus Nitrosotalea sp.]|nr:hypothetical protein [Candidatus Nitrosotalea sp.]
MKYEIHDEHKTNPYPKEQYGCVRTKALVANKLINKKHNPAANEYSCGIIYKPPPKILHLGFIVVSAI